MLWAATGPAFAALPPLKGLMYGVWLLPGVLGALVIRKPGAAVFTELVAAVVSALLGNACRCQAVRGRHLARRSPLPARAGTREADDAAPVE